LSLLPVPGLDEMWFFFMIPNRADGHSAADAEVLAFETLVHIFDRKSVGSSASLAGTEMVPYP
jgi:hypothetical protein